MSKNKQRLWQLRLNLDAFNALAASFYSDEHRALAFQGFGLGMNNGQCPTTAPEAFRIAFDLGLSMRSEAEALILAQSENGQKSAKVRKDRYGSAQPKMQNIEGASEGTSEGASKGVRGNIEPNHKPITNNQERINQEPKTVPQTPKGDDLIVWELWKNLNDQGYGVSHIGWNPSWTRKVKQAKALCAGKDFADVVAFAMENMAKSKWLRENPSVFTITHLLVVDNFLRYTGGYADPQVWAAA